MALVVVSAARAGVGLAPVTDTGARREPDRRPIQGAWPASSRASPRNSFDPCARRPAAPDLAAPAAKGERHGKAYGGCRFSFLYMRGVRPVRLARDSEILSRTILAGRWLRQQPPKPLDNDDDDLRLSRREIDDATLWRQPGCPVQLSTEAGASHTSRATPFDTIDHMEPDDSRYPEPAPNVLVRRAQDPCVCP